MSRYYKAEDIEREIVRLLRLGTTSDFEFGIKYGIETLGRGLKDLPTIDIVHCRECKCCRDELIEEYMPLYIYCEKWNHETGFDDFCSAGERIDNE